MQHHFIHVSGLIAQEDLPRWARQGLMSGLLRWAEPQDALKSLSSEEATAELWWFYAPPWSTLGRGHAAGGQGVDFVAPWAAVHRQLLRARQTAAAPVRLLSVLHAPPVSLVAEALQPFTAMESLPSSSIEDMLSTLQAEVIQTGAPHDDVGALLAQLYAWAAPGVWDVLEALEAADWDSSRTPLMREDVSPPEPEAVAHLARLLAAGEQAPMMEAAVLDAKASLDGALASHHQEVEGLKQQMAAQAAALDQNAQALEAAQGQFKEAKEEGELLLLQLHQVQEELEQLFLQAKDKDAAHQKALAEAESAAKAAAEQATKALAAAQADGKAALDKARADHQSALEKAQAQHKAAFDKGLADAKAALDKSQADAKAAADKATAAHQQEAAKLKDEAAAKTAERDQARKALAESQAAMDKARTEHQAALDKAHSDARAQAEKARAEAKAAVDKSQADAKAALDKARAEHQAALDATQGQLQEAQQEGELLLLQLHQVQEELEQIFLRGKDQEAAAAKAQADAKATIDKLKSEATERSRKLEAAEKRQIELSDALDKTRMVLKDCQAAIAEHEAQATQMRTSFDDELGRLQANLAQLQTEHRTQLEASRKALSEAAESEAAERDKLQAQHAAALDALQAQLTQARAATDAIRSEALSAQQQAELEAAQLRQQLESSRAEAQAQLQAQVQHHREALHRLASERDEQLDALRAEHAQALQAQAQELEERAALHQHEKQAHESALMQLREQRDQSLLDLHHAHEELELAARREQDLVQATESGAVEREKLVAQHTAERDKLQAQHAAALDALQAQLTQARAATDAIRSEALSAQQQAELEAAQLRQQLESSRAEAQAQLQAQVQHHREALHRLACERDEQLVALRAEHAQALQSHDHALRQAHDTLETRTLELREQHHALLLELHRAHEDLEVAERASEAAKAEAQSAVKEAGRRIAAIKRRVGGGDLKEVDVLGMDSRAATPWVEWRVRDVDAGNGRAADVTFRTVVGSAGLGIMQSGEGADAAFARGPLFPALLARQRDTGQMALFREIGASAWGGLCAALTLAAKAVTDPSALLNTPSGFNAAAWQDALLRLQGELTSLPAVFRFDAVRLRDELVGNRYEHLWLDFEGACHGASLMPGFSLRLGAVTGAANGFSVLSQLEIPLAADGAPPFEGWFQERVDDLGPKLELRADLARGAFDMRVWATLAKPAQALLLSVIAALPGCLTRLQKDHPQLTRPWTDWTTLLDGMIAVMRREIAAAAKQTPTSRAAAPTTSANVRATAASQPIAQPLPEAAQPTAAATAAPGTAGPTHPTPQSSSRPSHGGGTQLTSQAEVQVLQAPALNPAFASAKVDKGGAQTNAPRPPRAKKAVKSKPSTPSNKANVAPKAKSAPAQPSAMAKPSAPVKSSAKARAPAKLPASPLAPAKAPRKAGVQSKT